MTENDGTSLTMDSTPAASASTASHQPPHAQLIQILVAIWKARALYAAARLNLADRISEGGQTAAQLAEATGMHTPSLRRLLRALAGMGFLSETEPTCFSLTPLGATLKTDAPGGAHATVLTLCGDWQWKAWDNFLYSIRTGEPAMLKAFGKNLFEYLAANPQDSARFNEAMIGIHGGDGAAVVASYDFSSYRSIADLGGGTGTLLTTILRSHEHLRGLLLERPETVPHAKRRVDSCGMSARCDVVVGDFFHAIPSGYDAYILAHVLHDWTDDQALPILRNCRNAIPAHGRLLIIETVIPADDTPHQGKLMDLLMLTVTGGVERTMEEFSTLLASAGFRLGRVIPTANNQDIVEALPV